MSQFVHLHSHTEYSLLDGLSKIKHLPKKTKELGMNSIAITDHGSMFGVIEFYKACLEEGVKPIIGCEMYMAPRAHTSKEGRIDADPYHMTVIAKNYQGYLNLMKLVSISHVDGFYYRPRIDRELLKQYHQGLIILSACPAGEFIRTLEKDISAAEETARFYRDLLGEGNYFFELQNHHYDELLQNPHLEQSTRNDLSNMLKIQNMTWDAVKELSPKLGIPMVATNDFHYIDESDAEAQDALVCVATGKLISDTNRLKMITTPNLYLKSPQEMAVSFKDLPEALTNTQKIADSCELEIPMGVAKFPIFETPENKPPMEYLRELTYEKAKQRFELTPEAIERLDYELSVIEKKGYPTYFLIVADFMNWAHDNGIVTNTRGSAAGSLVLYALGITSVNPLVYALPFERFLNPLRPSLPDIDADMADDGREAIIEYIRNKYGHDKVAHIVTFGTMMGRAAIRDIGRVLNMPYGEVDAIAKLVPPPVQGFHVPLQQAINEVAELNQLYKTNMTVKRMLDLSLKVEGSVRHASVHAAGIVISPEPMTNYAPVQPESNKGDKVVIQYDYHAAEDIGLVKMDLLGIRNLAILGRAVEFVKQNRDIEVDLLNIPLDDPKAFKLLANGETMGLFQLEGDGMTKYLMELKPTSIYDISAMVALYRPGPLSIIPEYIARKRDPSKVTYPDPRMEKDLERSLGLMVYQDDVLFTAINLAGYNWEEVDKFRKAMGKKKPEEMAKEKDKFIQGCIDNGLTKQKAEQVFTLMEPFAKYGFNKAHAASYAIVAYQTAYMKANYTVEFMAALMTAEHGDSEKIAHAMEECARMGVMVLPPDINKSGVGFTLENIKDLDQETLNRQIGGVDLEKLQFEQAIRFGMSAIKNVGVNAIESVIRVRGEQPFTSLKDLCSRMDTKSVNRKTLDSLIKAGALDSFGNRAAQIDVLADCLEDAQRAAKAKVHGQTSLFDDGEIDEPVISFNLPDIPEFNMEEMLIHEKELLGFYLHEPPYAKHLKEIYQYVDIRLSQLEESHVSKRATLGGVITDFKKILTKKNASEMAFIKVFDGTGEVDTVIFPKIFAEKKDILDKEVVVVMTGKIERREDQFSFIVDEINKFDPDASQLNAKYLLNGSTKIAIPAGPAKTVEVEIPQDSASSDVLQQVNSALRQYPGNAAISLLIPTKGSYRKLSLNFTVEPNTQLVASIEQILGSGRVRII